MNCECSAQDMFEPVKIPWKHAKKYDHIDMTQRFMPHALPN
mgnify:CR=1 FL=1